MSDVGGLESAVPHEGEGGVSEELSEEAKQRFAAAGAALQQIYREERKAKARDHSVADAILQFLNDDQRSHLGALIAQLCARNCPSPFLLAILSLISEQCLAALSEYIREVEEQASGNTVALETALTAHRSLDREMNRALIAWVTRIQIVLSIDHASILPSVRQADGTLDLSLLQLTAFVIQECAVARGKAAEYERAQQLGTGILHMLFEPFLSAGFPVLPGGRGRASSD